MTSVFADSAYWIARLDRRDALHQRAVEVGSRLGGSKVTTSDLVLAEVLNFFARSGHRARRLTSQMVLTVERTADFEVVHHDAARFHAALAVYADRSDQSWSFTDCASLAIMSERRITSVLTYDRHFEQMGFVALLRTVD